MMHRQKFGSRAIRWFALLLLGVVALGTTSRVWAAAATCSGGTLAISLPNVTVTHNTTVGTLLGGPTTGTASFTCSGLPSGFSRFAIQIFNLQASQFVSNTLPSAASTNVGGTGSPLVFSTSVPGIGLQLTISPAMRGYDVNPGDQQSGSYIAGYITGTSGSLAVTYTAQLIVTGTVTPGTVGALTLFNYEWYIYGDTNSVSLGTHMTLSSGTQVTLQGCTVNTSSQNFTVTLPTIGTLALTGTGSSAGETGFNINLTCQTGTTVFVTMATANANAATGVINPTTGTGFATNVGVQLLNGSQTPITFNSAQNVGASPNGALAVPYFARYYQTGTPVTAGQVSATATFTMSYQ